MFELELIQTEARTAILDLISTALVVIILSYKTPLLAACSVSINCASSYRARENPLA